MKRLAVFCASSEGNNPRIREAAQQLGRLLISKDITLVYGGASRGIMQIIADEVLKNGGRVIGVIPRFLVDVEIAHHGLSELIITESMHERKLKMFELSDAFAALPGGVGTLEELFEIATWAQLNLHKKPIAVLNTDSYYDYLFRQLDHMVSQGLLKSFMRDEIKVATEPEELLRILESHEAGNGNFLQESLV